MRIAALCPDKQNAFCLLLLDPCGTRRNRAQTSIHVPCYASVGGARRRHTVVRLCVYVCVCMCHSATRISQNSQQTKR